MTIVVLGAGGPIGTAISEALSAAGGSHISVSRTASGPGAYAADRTDSDAILRIIAERNVSHIVDVIAYTEGDTLPLLNAIDGKIERYVMLSSADVYRNYGLLHRTESGTPTPILTENASLRTQLHPYRKAKPRANSDPQKWMDEYDKIPLENAVHTMQSDWTILRLPMVYGAKGKLARFGWIAQPMLAGAPEITTSKDWYNWTTTFGFIRNVAEAIVHAALHPNAANETFNITDHSAAPHSDWIDAFASASDWSGKIICNAPPPAPVAALDLSVPLIMKGDKLRARTGFEPPVSRAAAISNVLDHST